jgi:hypothetical protein
MMDANQCNFIIIPSTVYQNFTVLAATLPGLATEWNNHLEAEYPGASKDWLNGNGVGSGFGHVDMHIFSSYIADLLARDETARFTAFFQQVEFMLTCGDSRTEELTAVGFLEGLQNRLEALPPAHQRAPHAWLLPVSRRFWDSLSEFWQGK